MFVLINNKNVNFNIYAPFHISMYLMFLCVPAEFEAFKESQSIVTVH